jgi:hypothetical protein
MDPSKLILAILIVVGATIQLKMWDIMVVNVFQGWHNILAQLLLLIRE